MPFQGVQRTSPAVVYVQPDRRRRARGHWVSLGVLPTFQADELGLARALPPHTYAGRTRAASGAGSRWLPNGRMLCLGAGSDHVVAHVLAGLLAPRVCRCWCSGPRFQVISAAGGVVISSRR